MPIPTDTFWNIKRLNVVFALSAILLTLVTVGAIVQDHSAGWRQQQRDARAWESALVDDKIKRELTPQEQKEIQTLREKVADLQKTLETQDKAYEDLVAHRKKLESDKSTLEFKLNNLKSNVQVDEANLQDAIAAEDNERINKLTEQLAGPRKQLREWQEQQFQLAEEIRKTRQDIDTQTAQLDIVKKQYTELTTGLDSLEKKATNLDPARQGGIDGLIGTISSKVRDMPLMGFVNPSERVQQVVLPDVQTDVAFMKITTIDRCTTCHVNIAKKDYTAGNVIAYLEEQVATARKYNLPATPIAGPAAAVPAATAAKPGPVASPDFWHNWTLKLAPDVVRRNNVRIGVLARSVGEGKPATVTYDGQKLAEFKFDLDAKDPNEITKQNDILLALLDAYYQWSKIADVTATRGKAMVTISSQVPEAQINPPRNAGMRYIEELRSGLKAALEAADNGDKWSLLENRYRVGLTDELNVTRRKQGLAALDPSPALLAHPQLELYADVDSPHAMEAVGCTSCHDGSGQETDFVLAAHAPRDVWVDANTGVPILASQLTKPLNEHPEHHDLSSMLDAAEHAHSLHFEHPAASTQPAEVEGHAAQSRPLDYVDPATGKSGKVITQMAYWKKTYEPHAPRDFALVYHEWDWPMRTPEYIQANCARCHSDTYDIKETAPVLYEGKQLFTQLGCVNCHQMDSIPAYENRKVGTDLRHVTAKLSPEYINTWIWAPKAFRPTTKMPHFFMLENNSSDEEIRRTRQEARAITEYLVRTATPLPPAHRIPSGSQGSAEAGKALFNTLGCLACHQNLNERGQEWITTDLVKREGMKPDAAKAAFEKMSYNERQLFVQQHLAEPAGHTTRATYADGTPKPVFVQVGPELSGIGTKLTAGRTPEQAKQWLFDWLKEPRHYSEYTIMPRLRLDDQQAMDLVEYLLAQKRTTTDPKDDWKAGLAEVDSKKLSELVALQLKSQYSWKTAQSKADDDANLTQLATAALTTPVTTADEAKAEVAKMSLDQKRLVFLGSKMIANYSCMSCHAINGAESFTSSCPNLSAEGEKAVDKLDFGYLDHHKRQSLPPTSTVPMVNALNVEAANLIHDLPAGKEVSQPVEVAWPEVEHHRNEWITQKIKNSRVYDRGKALLEPTKDSVGSPYDKLKMPTFYLNDDQVNAIVTFVISNRDRLIKDKLVNKASNEEARKIARGRELTERYNCVACHQIERNLPQVQQYFKAEDVITKAPPSLRGEGNKIQYSWLFNFFKNVEQMRPLLFTGIRMPSFPANDDEWTAIIAYFNSVSNKEARQLAKHLDPIAKYVETKRKASTQPSSDTIGDDWWQQKEFAAAAETLKQWGLTFGHIKPIEVAPSASAADLNKVYKTLLFKARFTRELYEAPFPFVDTPRPELTDQRFKQGEQFFYEMQCLKCHVLGDPSIPGANKNPTAPNLSLASRRLQQRWVRHWVQEPNIIQVGTAMPPFFTGLPVNKLEGQPWHLAQPLGDPAQQAEHVKKVESTYGATVQEQTGLLLDFLYAAGVRGHTGVQPATPGTGPATAPSASAESALSRSGNRVYNR